MAQYQHINQLISDLSIKYDDVKAELLRKELHYRVARGLLHHNDFESIMKNIDSWKKGK